jgi:ribosome-associated protein
MEMPRGRDEPGKSRSRKKRESAAMQDLGESLAALPPGRLRELALPADLEDALRLLPSIRAREAARRHKQYIGRLMRGLEEERIGRLRALLRHPDRRRAVERDPAFPA